MAVHEVFAYLCVDGADAAIRFYAQHSARRRSSAWWSRGAASATRNSTSTVPC